MTEKYFILNRNPLMKRSLKLHHQSYNVYTFGINIKNLEQNRGSSLDNRDLVICNILVVFTKLHSIDIIDLAFIMHISSTETRSIKIIVTNEYETDVSTTH